MRWWHLDCYRHEHWEATIHILCYLKGTRTLGLVLGGLNPVQLLGYSDSNYRNFIETSWLIAGYCFSLGSEMISWCSCKGQTVANSTCYAKYMALHKSVQEAMFLRQMMKELDFESLGPTPIYCDNNTAIILSEDHIGHPWVKHIRVKYHYV